MGDRLKGKVAVVTGSGRGIGRAEVMALVEEGAKVVVNDLGVNRDGVGTASSPADDVVAEIKKKGGTAVANYDSVATLEGGANIIKTAVDNFGRIDILVNNAGFLRDRMFFNMAPEDWDAVLKVHLYGHFNCCKPASVLMRQQRSGVIINVGSSSGLGSGGQSNYSAAKEGIVGFTRTLARDMGRYNVYANDIRPGAATRMTVSPEMEEAVKGRIARGEITAEQAAARRPAEPEFIGPFIAWLAANAEKYSINGQDFAVSGGRVGLYSQPTIIKSIEKDVKRYGKWELAELDALMPSAILAGLVNPSPPVPPDEKKK